MRQLFKEQTAVISRVTHSQGFSELVNIFLLDSKIKFAEI